MKKTVHTLIGKRCALLAAIAIALMKATTASAQTAEDYEKLKALVGEMQKTIEAQNARIADLERKGANQPPPPMAPAAPGMAPTNAVVTSPSVQTIEKISRGETIGEPSPVTHREALNDQQD